MRRVNSETQQKNEDKYTKKITVHTLLCGGHKLELCLFLGCNKRNSNAALAGARRAADTMSVAGSSWREIKINNLQWIQKGEKIKYS